MGEPPLVSAVIGNLKSFLYKEAVQKRFVFMRHERFIPMEYANQELMDELNSFCVAIKIHLHPELFGEKLQDLQRRYGKPEIQDIDEMMNRLMQALRKDSKPMIKY